MSTILRSGKFIRCFASAARTVINSPKGYDSNLIQSSRSLTTGYSQTWSQKYNHQASESLEPLLQRLDSDVKKFGRLSRRDLDEMLEEVRHKHSVSSSQSLLVIRCCGNLVPEEQPKERTRLVEEIWKTLVERGVPMDISHYNALLRVYIENEHDFSPNEFLKELEGKGLQPNRVTYQRLMWRFCQRGDVDGASRILELMRSSQLPLSSAVLDALVLGHARLGDAAGARSVVTAMAGAGVKPGPRTYALLMGGSAARGDIEEVKNTLAECKEKEIYLSDKDLLDVVEECAVGGHEEHIEFLLDQMQHTAGYNQDAITLIIRLITRGCENAALQVYRTMTRPSNLSPESNSNYQGAFFIKHLVKANCQTDVILSICNQLQKDGLSPKALYLAAETAIQQGKEELSFALFRAMKNLGDPIRQHYFWPLFVSLRKQRNDEKIFNVLQMMLSEYKTGLSGETLREYVIPNLQIKDPNKILHNLREVGVNSDLASKMLVFCLLEDNKLAKAAEVAVKYNVKVNLNLCSKPMIAAFLNTKDVNSFVTLIHMSMSSDDSDTKSSQIEEKDDAEEDATFEQKEVVGKLLHNLIHNQKSLDYVPEILKSLYSRGLGISTKWAERIQENLGGNLTSEISEALANLTSDDLEPIVVEARPLPFIQRNSEQLEYLICAIQNKGEQPLGLRKQLLLAYMRENKIEKFQEYMKQLKQDNYTITEGTLAQICDYFAQNGDFENAIKYYEEIISKDPDFVIDSTKVIRLVQLMIINNQYDKCLALLQNRPINTEEFTPSFSHKSYCFRILNTLAEQGDSEKVNEIFNLLLEKKIMEVSNVNLGPLVKVHLISGNVKVALDEFERLCQQYRCTPYKNELTKKLIAEEDAAGLQKLTDLSTLVHGEVNSLYDLVFGFVECGRVKQARRILETPGMRTRNHRFNVACERYGQEGKVDYLEGLLEATRELSHIDRSEVFQQLLNTYTKEGNAEKALGLWTLLQEESLIPTDKFLNDLAQFLKSRNMSVPFVVPEVETENAPEPNQKPANKVEKLNKNVQSIHEKFNIALENGDVDTALSTVKNNLNKINKSDVSKLIERLVQSDNSNEALNVTLDFLKINKFPEPKVLRYLLNNLAAKGDTASFEKIEEYLNDEQKRILSFNNRKYNAAVVSGNFMSLLNDLDNQITSASDNDVQMLEKSFPMGGMCGVLSHDNSSLQKCLEIAEKYAKRGIFTPYNAIWMHYILDGQDDKAKAIWDQYLSNSNNVMFKRILKESSNTGDISLLTKLIDYLKTSKMINYSAIGVVYSRQIDILNASDKPKEAMQTIETALSNGCSLEHINKTALLRTKSSIEAIGETFTYKIITNSK